MKDECVRQRAKPALLAVRNTQRSDFGICYLVSFGLALGTDLVSEKSKETVGRTLVTAGAPQVRHALYLCCLVLAALHTLVERRRPVKMFFWFKILQLCSLSCVSLHISHYSCRVGKYKK